MPDFFRLQISIG